MIVESVHYLAREVSYVNLKKILLMADDSVKMTNKSLSKIYHKYRSHLSDVYQILVPIPGFDRTYMPIELTRICKMTHGIIRYGMSLMETAEDLDDDVVRSFGANVMEIGDCEELLQALFNISAFNSYHQVCVGNNLDFTSNYIDLEYIEVHLFEEKDEIFSYRFDQYCDFVEVNGKKRKYDDDHTPFDRDKDDEPDFYIYRDRSVRTLVKNPLGLFHQLKMIKNQMVNESLLIITQGNKGLKWKQEKPPCTYPIENTIIGIVDTEGCWITLVDADDYDQLLRIESAVVHLAGMDDGDVTTTTALQRDQSTPISLVYDPDVQPAIGSNEWELTDALWNHIEFDLSFVDMIASLITSVGTYFRVCRETIRQMIINYRMTNNEEVGTIEEIDKCISLDLTMTIKVITPTPSLYVCIHEGSYSDHWVTLDEVIHFIRKNVPE